jgi:hypothetical protein
MPSLNDPQPDPIQNTSPAIWPLVIEDLRGAIFHEDLFDAREQVLADAAERHTLGTEKYGVPLQANNGRDPRIDAYQEALDLMVYLRQALAEGRGSHRIYVMAMRLAVALRDELD